MNRESIKSNNSVSNIYKINIYIRWIRWISKYKLIIRKRIEITCINIIIDRRQLTIIYKLLVFHVY